MYTKVGRHSKKREQNEHIQQLVRSHSKRLVSMDIIYPKGLIQAKHSLSHKINQPWKMMVRLSVTNTLSAKTRLRARASTTFSTSRPALRIACQLHEWSTRITSCKISFQGDDSVGIGWGASRAKVGALFCVAAFFLTLSTPASSFP